MLSLVQENTGRSHAEETCCGDGTPTACWNPAVEDSWKHSSVVHSTGGGMMRRTRSVFSMASSSESSFESSSESSELESQSSFGHQVRRQTCGRPESPVFDGDMRKSIEPYLKTARLNREKARKKQTDTKVADYIASSMGVPYTKLRHERPFLFDEHTHPLHTLLAEALSIPDLSRAHEYGQEALLKPLLDPSVRQNFHAAYDSFVTSFCIPLLHSLVITKKILHASPTDRITYRYQAFPSIGIVTPGSTSAGPVCDSVTGHSIGCLSFHIPLTPSFGTNSLYVESHPGREDWHPLHCKAVGLGYLYDGIRCLHFPLDNTTSDSRVSLDFHVLIYREGSTSDGTGLCPTELVEDRMSEQGPGYYDEVVIDLSKAVTPGSRIVTKKYGNRLLDPDHRVGAPFA